MKWLLVAMYVAKIADVGTTELALSRGAHEQNPLNRSRPVMYALAAVMPIAIYKLSGKLWENKKSRVAACAAAIVVWSLGAYRNYRFEGRTADAGSSSSIQSGGFRLQFAVRF